MVGFTNDRLILKKPNGEDIAVPLQEMEPQDIDAIEAGLNNPVPNWNNSGPAPFQIVADVEVDDETGRYKNFAIMAFHIKND
ncbi:hypothetical protein NX773_00850 [Massilia solisilvae]|uniref:Uncharacterized protein n=1 Tax=Massilia solisilvae TaxID=1811225 RepID=A0ABT2BDW0_9BURK|nr:hypothetical protein [Massilia solisilvae]MCS0606711.1 hypothetical protein [Massilia solisilvae]